MKDKEFYPQARSPLKHLQGQPWGATRSPRELDLPLSSQPLPSHCRHLSWLKRLARAVLAAALLAGLVTWGLHSRFGLLLLLLLR
ncbi:hypothetical protein ABH911_000079 [Pseudomonas protegens]|jgi:hypothetical protein|uniref:hypothetical protein n=1 Tax=Pseudomonas TaxID=286 RepID=UPI00069F5275|nr:MULTISPECIES: hypothetical protein [Pseudomonas]UVM09276.1 hypothetical protein LOY29_21895 [Pseudomonas protegens]SCZ63560.1 hypothetical protein SAMN03159460_02149 [Pseudomonas sp. NFPP17]SDA59769.1 hypothetical protein SAMN03159464_02329 [Pseudomonas sp. NFPP15]SEK64618.1 hypothetical protein SAMN03159324_01460 [Pseudomonas sp. NFPP18]SFA57259.1 hypothetical protein SAMN03159320_02148 [Pseudomonas sp. NFPP13]